MVRNVAASNLPNLIAAIQKAGHPFTLAFMLMLEAGLRLQETRALKWSHLVWDNTCKSVIELTADMTKGGRPRSVPVSARLESTITAQYYNCQDLGTRLQHRPVLAFKERRSAISARQLQRACKRIGQDVLGHTLTPHMLRHTFATRLLAVSNASVVQNALGHSKLSTTQIYLHPTADDLQRAVSSI